MKKALLFLPVFLLFVIAKSQDVAYGNTTPAVSLHSFDSTNNGLEIKSSLGRIAQYTTSVDTLITIQIGKQNWTLKNLDVAFYKNGDAIPQVNSPKKWAALTTGAWCYYNNDPSTNDTYGKLYNWYAVSDPRGLAPEGLHIPTNAEWIILEISLGGAPVAGGKMKVAGTQYWSTPNDYGNNISGWTGLPAGYRMNDGTFRNMNNFGYWWSTTEDEPTTAWTRYLNYSIESIGRAGSNKQGGSSVRCIMD